MVRRRLLLLGALYYLVYWRPASFNGLVDRQKLQAPIREKLLAMSAAAVDRLLRAPRRASQSKRPRRIEPAPKRRIRMRTFADWNEPLSGWMEMDLVAYYGTVNRGSYVHTLTLTGIASGWKHCAALAAREGGLVVETLDRIRLSLSGSAQWMWKTAANSSTTS